MSFSRTSSGVIKSSAFSFSVLCFHHITAVFRSLPLQLSQLCVQLSPSFHPEVWIHPAVQSRRWQPCLWSSKLSFLTAWAPGSGGAREVPGSGWAMARSVGRAVSSTPGVWWLQAACSWECRCFLKHSLFIVKNVQVNKIWPQVCEKSAELSPAYPCIPSSQENQRPSV